MKKSLKELYESAIIVKDKSLDGKINSVKRSPEQQAMHDKLVEAYERLNLRKTQASV